MESGYIRGGVGVPTDSRHVLRVAVFALLAALAVLTVALTIDAFRQDSRNHRLRDHGVAVQVTVTSCVGTATGTGITVNGFTCRGSFGLRGHRYDEVIGGSSQLHAAGDVVQGVADPDSPSTLSTAQAVGAVSSDARPFIFAAIPALAFLMVGAFAQWLTSRGGRRAVR
jgi:hypothetical protein